jgi:Transglycosylase SLT domain
MTTLVLSPILALTLVSATQPVAGTQAITVGRVQATNFTVAKPDIVDAVDATPTPAPAPPAPAAKPRIKTARVAAPPVAAGPPADPNSVIGIIEAAAARWGVSGSWMVGIARCESGLRTTAYNPHGPYIGLFQFLRSTFAHNGGTNIYDAADQANIAAKMLAHGQAHQWSCA